MRRLESKKSIDFLQTGPALKVLSSLLNELVAYSSSLQLYAASLEITMPMHRSDSTSFLVAPLEKRHYKTWTRSTRRSCRTLSLKMGPSKTKIGRLSDSG